eukprot:PhM_4_TR17752/c0_g1_i1/m.54911
MGQAMYGEALAAVVSTVFGTGSAWVDVRYRNDADISLGLNLSRSSSNSSDAAVQCADCIDLLRVFFSFCFFLCFAVVLRVVYEMSKRETLTHIHRVHETLSALRRTDLADTVVEQTLDFQQYVYESRGCLSESTAIALDELPAAVRRSLNTHLSLSIIDRSAVFPGSAEAVAFLARRVFNETACPGEQIVRWNTQGACMYFVGFGEARAFVPTMAEGHLANLGVGTFFGEISLHFNTPRTASVVALTYMDLYRLEKDGYTALQQKFPDVMGVIQETMENRLEQLRSMRIPAPMVVRNPEPSVNLASSTINPSVDGDGDYDQSRRQTVTTNSSEIVDSPIVPGGAPEHHAYSRGRMMSVADFEDYDVRWSISSGTRRMSMMPVVDDRLVRIAMENHHMLKDMQAMLTQSMAPPPPPAARARAAHVTSTGRRGTHVSTSTYDTATESTVSTPDDHNLGSTLMGIMLVDGDVNAN